jgi:hypothetical protein
VSEQPAYYGDPLPPGMVRQDFPIVVMGLGQVEVGDATHEGKPALWFGRGGRGLDAPPQDINRAAHDGETLALFVFQDPRGIDAIEQQLQRVRAMFHGFAQNGEG